MKSGYVRDPETGMVYSLRKLACHEAVLAVSTGPSRYIRDPETGLACKIKGLSAPSRKEAPPSLLSSILHEQLKVSVGCTEISAIAYAVSIAYNTLTGLLPFKFTRYHYLEKHILPPDKISRINLTIDRKVYKNAFAAELPIGKGLHGISYVAALGVLGDPLAELNVLKGLTAQSIITARRLAGQDRVKVIVYNKPVTSPYIKAEVSARGNTATAVIHHHHSNIIMIKLNNRVVYRAPEQNAENPFSPAMRILSGLSLHQIINLSGQLTGADKRYLEESLRTNEDIGRYGMRHYRAGITGALRELRNEGILKSDMKNRAQLETTAAVEARMSGAPYEVMTVAGSGNQGLIAMLPINAIAREMGLDQKRLLEALALSCLVTAYTTCHTGYLTPLCGCFVKSGLGATAGIAYYLNGDENQISAAIKNMVGVAAGVICDGAKVGCALKAAAATTTAVEAALLGLKGVVIPPHNGIVNQTAENTIRNLGRLSMSMDKSDRTIVDVLTSKHLN